MVGTRSVGKENVNPQIPAPPARDGAAPVFSPVLDVEGSMRTARLANFRAQQSIMLGEQPLLEGDEEIDEDAELNADGDAPLPIDVDADEATGDVGIADADPARHEPEGELLDADLDVDPRVDPEGEVDDEDDDGQLVSGGTSPARPAIAIDRPKYKLSEQTPVKITRGASTYYVVLDLEHTGGKFGSTRVIQLSSLILDSSGKVIGREFDEMIRVSQPISPFLTRNVHGISDATLRDKRSAPEVWKSWLGQLYEDVGPSCKELVLVAHNGRLCDFRLVFMELARAGLSFRANLRVKCLDTLVLAKSVSSFANATSAEWPRRCKLTAKELREGKTVGKPSFRLRSVVDFILLKKHQADGGEGSARTFADTCGAEHDAVADARGAAMILVEKDVWRKRFNKVALPSAPLAEYGKDVVLWSDARRLDPVGEGWQETAAPPVEEQGGRKFVPPRGSSPLGGPSHALKRALRLTGAAGSAAGAMYTCDALMLAIFLFMFTHVVVQYMVNATNAKAAEQVVRVKEGGKWKLRLPRDSDSPQVMSTLRPRSPTMAAHPMGLGEMYVLLGSRIYLGGHQRRKQSHIWMASKEKGGREGFRVPEVADIYRSKRYMNAMAMLSFEMPGGGVVGDPLRKLRWVDTYLMERAQLAWDIEPVGALDEARIKLFSKWCPFLWVMMCKPTPVGCTVYCLAFTSLYLYKWRWWLGKRTKTHGQPSDKGAVDEDSSDGEHGFMRELVNDLVDEQFDNTNFTLVTDKAFSSMAIARWLDSRGIAMLGMIRALRPKNFVRAVCEYWPFRRYDKVDESEYKRGWMRQAYTLLPSGRWLQATLWRDSRFVTMISTTFISAATVNVMRYSRATSCSVAIVTCVALTMYVKYMGAVDRLDRSNATANIRMHRCPVRYHRQLFHWLLSSNGHHNVRIIFEHLWPDIEQFKQDHAHIGWTTWFQDELGLAIMRYGVKLAKEELGSQEHRDRHGLVPFFMPVRQGTKRSFAECAAAPLAQTSLPVDHDLVKASKVRRHDGLMNRGRCASCYAMARAAGTGPHHRPVYMGGKYIGGGSIPFPRKACSVCKVYLCDPCHNEFWDHNHGKRCKLVRNSIG